MQSIVQRTLGRRVEGENLWLETTATIPTPVSLLPFHYQVLQDEESVGKAMFEELKAYANENEGEISIVLLGGRGAQAMYRLIAGLAETDEIDSLLARLNVFTQDALAQMRMNNGLSFVRDFERLLGPKFFAKIKSFTPMMTESQDIEGELINYLEELEAAGGIDIFFLGFGPEADAASHLCYIKPNSGARVQDIAGIIPISSSILEHHINKFKVGGSEVSTEDEAECRIASHIVTLGPAAILGARKIVQSIVDASTAPAKRECFARMITEEISVDPQQRERQLDANPGLWIRLHPNATTFVLPDLF